MKLIDMHCDTLWKLMDLDREGNLGESNCSVTIPGMKQAGTLAQFFACFTYLEDYRNKEGYEGAYRHVLEMIEFFYGQLEQFPGEIALACSQEDMKRNEADGRISAFLTVEEGGVANGRMDRIEELYRKGVRLLTPVWNYENCFGYPNSRDYKVMEKGLKPFGIEAVGYMGELGMVVDVSHASDRTFRDILVHARGPVVASHSNCRALCGHPRNLTDDMIRALAEKGGVAGLNLYGYFLSDTGESKIEYMVEHIVHMLHVGGSEFPAIGTDFDGFDGIDVLEIPRTQEIGRLWDALREQGIPQSQIDKIQYKNAARIIKEL